MENTAAYFTVDSFLLPLPVLQGIFLGLSWWEVCRFLEVKSTKVCSFLKTEALRSFSLSSLSPKPPPFHQNYHSSAFFQLTVPAASMPAATTGRDSLDLLISPDFSVLFCLTLSVIWRVRKKLIFIFSSFFLSKIGLMTSEFLTCQS